MKRAVVVGATSGIGRAVAQLLVQRGWRVGVAGRRGALLDELKAQTPGLVEAAVLDVTATDAPSCLFLFFVRLGGMDVFFYCAGVGWRNDALDGDIELHTVRTNAEGFVRMVGAAFCYYRDRGLAGRIAVVSSIAGTKGLGAAPAYSATKSMQATYVEALQQLARARRLPVTLTDIRPGFVDTPLLGGGRYPMKMSADEVARAIVRAVERGQGLAIVDFRYRLLTAVWRLLPRWLWLRMPVGIDISNQFKR